MNTFKLKILAADKVVFDGECEKMTIPCFDGEKGILAHHENILMATDIGITKFKPVDEDERVVFTGLGFIEDRTKLMLTEPEKLRRELKKHCVKSVVRLSIITQRHLYQELWLD